MSAKPVDAGARQRRFRLLILSLGTVLLIAFSYGSGMRGQKKALELVKQERRVLKERLRLSELSLRARDAALLQWEARRQLAVALRSLDKDNFGDLREAIEATVVRIEAAAQVGAADAADLSGALEILRGMDIAPTENRGQLRDALVNAADVMDKALEQTAPGPDSITPVSVPAPNLNDIPKLPGPEIGR